MTVLIILATLFALLAVLLVFVWPLVIAGPHRRMQTIRSAEMRFLAGTVAAVVIGMVMAPYAATALISGGGAVQVFAHDVSALSFGL